jgi:hypothetical protein
MPTNPSINWTPVFINAAVVIFAAGIIYAKVISIEEEIEPGILKVAEERTSNLRKEIEELKAEMRVRTKDRFYRWEADQLIKRVERLEAQLERRVTP